MADQEQGPSFDEQLAELQRMISGRGGIGSDARMPVGPAIRPTTSNPAYTLGGRRMEGRRPLTDVELNTPRAAAELTGIPQAANALGEAYQDPSIPNLTNAGVRTGMAAMRPGMAVGSLGAGYLAAIMKDAGIFDTSAEAQTAKKGAAKEPLPGLTKEMQAEYDAAQKRLADGDFSGSAERRQVEKTVEDFRRASIDYQTKNADSIRQAEANKKSSDQAEYDRRVQVAEASKKREMDRDIRFQDTTPGKVYEKTAGFTPFLAAAGLSGLNRAATGPLKSAWAPLAAGAAEGFAAVHAPLAADAYLVSPPLNPEREAYRVYARDLPQGHPDKESAAAYALGRPEKNPVRTLAADELYDPWKFAERTGVGLVEGALGQFGGSKVPQLVGRMYEGAKSGISRFLRGPESSPTTVGTAGGTLPAANALSPTSTAGATSSAEILPPTRNALAGPEAETARLADRIRAPSPLPEISGPSSQPASKTPDVLIRTTDSRGIVQYRDLNGNYASHPQKGDKTKVVRKGKAEAPPEKPSEVFNDDLRPYGYRNKLDPQE